jgi:hypothetical protein
MVRGEQPAPGGHELLEALAVKRSGFDLERVAALAGDQPVAPSTLRRCDT